MLKSSQGAYRRILRGLFETAGSISRAGVEMVCRGTKSKGDVERYGTSLSPFISPLSSGEMFTALKSISLLLLALQTLAEPHRRSHPKIMQM